LGLRVRPVLEPYRHHRTIICIAAGMCCCRVFPFRSVPFVVLAMSIRCLIVRALGCAWSCIGERESERDSLLVECKMNHSHLSLEVAYQRLTQVSREIVGGYVCAEKVGD